MYESYFSIRINKVITFDLCVCGSLDFNNRTGTFLNLKNSIKKFCASVILKGPFFDTNFVNVSEINERPQHDSTSLSFWNRLYEVENRALF